MPAPAFGVGGSSLDLVDPAGVAGPSHQLSRAAVKAIELHRGCCPRRAPKCRRSLVFVSLYQASPPLGVGLMLGAFFSSVSPIVDLCLKKRMVVMLDRRRMLAAALAVVAYPAGVVFAQPVPFHPPMPPPRREVRPRRPGGPGPWYWSRGRWRWNGRRWVWVSGRWRR